MTPGCDGCETLQKERKTVAGCAHMLKKAREKDRWDWVDEVIDELEALHEPHRHAGA